MIFKNKDDQLNKIKDSQDILINTDLFDLSFICKLEGFNIDKYKPTNINKKVFSFLDKNANFALKDEDRYILEIFDGDYISTIKQFLDHEDIYMKIMIINTNENDVITKTNVFSKVEGKLLGVHILSLNKTNLMIDLYEKINPLGSDDLSNLKTIEHIYNRELLYKTQENQYIGISKNTNNELLKFFQISFIKK